MEVINEKVDVWALGCILFTLAFFTQPFQEGGNLQIIGGQYTIPEDNKFSKYVTALIKKMLTLSPKKRPDIKKVMEMMDKWQASKLTQIHRYAHSSSGITPRLLRDQTDRFNHWLCVVWLICLWVKDCRAEEGGSDGQHPQAG